MVYMVEGCGATGVPDTARHMKRDTSVNLRITSELRAELQRLADADGRKLSGYIVRLLELHVHDQGADKPKGRK
jgi:predicted DNA binding CopG/RHH family protein